MIDSITEDISIFLPQYLSDKEKDSLKEELKTFHTKGTQKSIYTESLNNVNYLLQGDGIFDVEYCNFPDTNVKKIPVLLLSNTCDMSIDNKRMNSCRISFVPLIDLKKYKERLMTQFDETRVESHIKDIMNQHITQIFYLPKGGKLTSDFIAFFDMAISLPLKEERVNEMCNKKIFTLSDFGFYLFLLKLSMHFTRVKERIGRTMGFNYGDS